MAEGNPRSIQALKDKIEFYEGLKVGGKLNVRGEQILHELRTKLAVEEGSGAGGGAGGAAAAPHIPMAPVGAYAGSTTRVLDPNTGRVLSRTKNPNAARGVDQRAAAAASTTKLAAHRNIAAFTTDFAKKVERANSKLEALLHFGQTEGPSKAELDAAKGDVAEAMDLLRRWHINENGLQERGGSVWYKPSLSVAGETLREQIYQLRTSLDWVHQEMSGGGRHRRTRRRRTRARKARHPPARRHRRKTKRRRRRRRRRRIGHDEKELKRVIAQHRRYQIARGDKRFKATRGLIKWSRPNKTRRANRNYYRRRKKRTTRKHRRR